jgi:hypothetical protein
MRLSLMMPLCVVLTAGCASVMNDVTHPIKIETMTSAGDAVPGADCTLVNDKATSTMKSGETGNVRRSSVDLDITCKHPQNPDSVAKATSRVNGGMFGNIILGGGIGAIVDHNRGTAYTYPTWIQMIFGQTMLFDRREEKEGKPTPPSPAASAAAGAAAAPAAAASAAVADKRP